MFHSWYQFGRMGPKRNYAGRERDARADGTSGKVQDKENTKGRPYRRLPPYDSPDSSTYRNTHRVRGWGMYLFSKKS